MPPESFLPDIHWILFFLLFAISEDFIWRNIPRTYILRCLPLFKLGRISRSGIGAVERRDRFEILRGVEAEWLSSTCAVLRHRRDRWFGPGPLRFTAEANGDYLDVKARVAWWWILSIALIPTSPFIFVGVCVVSAIHAVEQWRQMAEDLTGSRKKDG